MYLVAHTLADKDEQITEEGILGMFVWALRKNKNYIQFFCVQNIIRQINIISIVLNYYYLILFLFILYIYYTI